MKGRAAVTLSNENALSRSRRYDTRNRPAAAGWRLLAPTAGRFRRPVHPTRSKE
jgi:hypothetical protein